jgi:hypothetical protein
MNIKKTLYMVKLQLENAPFIQTPSPTHAELQPRRHHRIAPSTSASFAPTTHASTAQNTTALPSKWRVTTMVVRADPAIPASDAQLLTKPQCFAMTLPS